MSDIARKPEREVGIALMFGIVFMPYIFSWFTLRAGYSTKARLLSLGWCALVVSIFAVKPSALDPSKSSTERPAEQGPQKKITAKLEILQHRERVENISGGTYRTIHVQVRNNTSRLMDYVQVNATWFDASGRIVGTGMGNTSNLASGAHRTIDVLGLNVEGAARYELDAQQF